MSLLNPEQQKAWDEYQKVRIPLFEAYRADTAKKRGEYEEYRTKREAEYRRAIQPAFDKYLKACAKGKEAVDT